MFCPECGDEKREEFTICPICNVPLVEELPSEPEPEYIELETVFTSVNQADILIAKTLLESAEIQFFVKGEFLSIPYMGTLSVPVEIQVGKDDVEEARALLKDLEENESEEKVKEMRELISNMSDEELYEMLELKHKEYIPEAIIIAKEEAVKRGGLELIKQRLGR